MLTPPLKSLLSTYSYFTAILCRYIKFTVGMENIRKFLECSSIHGLAYISTTGKYEKIFWTIVVVIGFTGAGVLIHRSFKSWENTPVSTTIETHSITDITFPRITVCPPKNTYTNLNYDLMMTENMTLRNDTRQELANYAMELLYDQLHDTVMLNLSKLQDNDRYNNWYQGYTRIDVPYYICASFMCTGLNYDINTAAKSGTVSTQYFGDNFDAEKVEALFIYKIRVIPLDSVLQNENVTLHFAINKIPMKETRMESYSLRESVIKVDEQHISRNYTPPGSMDVKSRLIQLQRGVTRSEILKQKMNVMPGFRLTWNFTGRKVDPVPEAKYSNEVDTKAFVRFANIFQHTDLSMETIWRVVRKTKLETSLFMRCGTTLYLPENKLSQVIAVEQKLHIKSLEQTLKNISAESLKTAAEMFLYLNICPDQMSIQWAIFYQELFKSQTPYQILLTLNRINLLAKTSDSKNHQTIGQKLFKRITVLFSLKYEEIKILTPGVAKYNLYASHRNTINLTLDGNLIKYI